MMSLMGYPLMAAAMASAMPVLPLVASMSVSPGLSAPFRSASLIMLSAGLSNIHTGCPSARCGLLYWLTSDYMLLCLHKRGRTLDVLL